MVYIWQDESSLIHTDNTKKPVFSTEQVAILKELRDSGMVSTAHVCQPQIQQAVLATGLTEKQVKVNNCVQLIHCHLFGSLHGHTQHGFSTEDVSFMQYLVYRSQNTSSCMYREALLLSASIYRVGYLMIVGRAEYRSGGQMKRRCPKGDT